MGFWSDFRMQNHSVLKNFFQVLNRLKASVVSKRLQNVLSPKCFAFCTYLDHTPESVTTTGAPPVLTRYPPTKGEKGITPRPPPSLEKCDPSRHEQKHKAQPTF